MKNAKWTKESLLEMLKDHVVEVVFTKADGSDRVMKCTLKEDVIKPFLEGIKNADRQPNHVPNAEAINVIDIEKNGWRSFRMDSIKSVKKV